MKITDDVHKFEMVLNVQNYRPDELKVVTNPSDHSIIIEGKREERNRNNSADSSLKSEKSVLQQFRRQFSLPASCELSSVESSLSRGSGVLVVTAKKRPNLTSTSTSLPRVTTRERSPPLTCTRRTLERNVPITNYSTSTKR